MKYESEILYDLMKRDGLLNPSQENLPYESELKEKYVNDVVGAYPKLQDYRPEWLNYNKCEYIPADFPTESQTNQTSGTFENVIPFAYDVATLKGKTLVTNYASDIVEATASGSWIENPVQLTKVTLPVKPSTNYLFVVDVIENSLIGNETINNSIRFGETDASGSQPSAFTSMHAMPLHQIGIYNFILTTKSDISNINLFDRKQLSKHCNSGKIKFRYMIIEHQQGMENWDIPYFEGMQSVQMPVLTTTGKNLFDGELELGDIGSNDGIQTQGDFAISKNFNVINGGVNVICSIESSVQGRIYYYDGNKNYISTTLIANLEKTPQNAKYFKLRLNKDFLNSNIMMVYDTSITPYEPYQSNILTVNDEVELRGYGNVQDTLDLKTGELTQCIVEYTITGNEKWVENTETNCQRFSFTRADMLEGVSTNDYWIYVQSEKLNSVMWRNSWTTTNTITMMNNKVYMHFPLGTTMEQAKSLMVGSKIQYAIKPTIKTVDLNCINEDNAECDFIPIMDTLHYQTASNTIPPLVDLTVCVEATTQNLASFVNLEGVEHDG